MSTEPRAGGYAYRWKLEEHYAGEDIERWMLKCLIGLGASGNLNNVKIKSECIDLLLDRIGWPEGWGLYWRVMPSSPVYHSDSFAMETVVHPANRIILSATFMIRGLPLTLCLGKPHNKKAFGIWRPPALVLRGPDREKQLILEWYGEHGTEAIFLDRAGTYDGPPPDWKIGNGRVSAHHLPCATRPPASGSPPIAPPAPNSRSRA